MSDIKLKNTMVFSSPNEIWQASFTTGVIRISFKTAIINIPSNPEKSTFLPFRSLVGVKDVVDIIPPIKNINKEYIGYEIDNLGESPIAAKYKPAQKTATMNDTFK